MPPNETRAFDIQDVVLDELFPQRIKSRAEAAPGYAPDILPYDSARDAVMPFCWAEVTGGQNIGSGLGIQLQPNRVIVDPYNMLHNGNIIVPCDGLWLFEAFIMWLDNAVGKREAWLQHQRGGASPVSTWVHDDFMFDASVSPWSGAGAQFIKLGSAIPCRQYDLLQAVVWQDSGGDRSVIDNGAVEGREGTWMKATLLGKVPYAV